MFYYKYIFVTQFSYFNSLENETSKFLQLSCENEKMEDFQNFLRAGLKDEIQKFLEGQSVDVLKSKFYIDMRLDEKQHGKDVERDNVRVSTMEQSMENGEIEMQETDQCLELTKGFNTRMTVNALHLAIFSRQLESVRCLLDHIFERKLEDVRDFIDD